MEKQATRDMPVKASCHCGAISITVPRRPKLINECQCTICRRYAAAWEYYNTKDVEITTKDDSSVMKYCWGSRKIDFNFCSTCGCMCYWYPLEESKSESSEDRSEMGINTRMIDPALLRNVNRVLSFDDYFRPIKNKEAAHAEDMAKY